MTLNDYLSKNMSDKNTVAGFTIRKGKKIYWYITPMPRSGLYRCLSIESDGSLGWPRWIPGETEITVIYKKERG